MIEEKGSERLVSKYPGKRVLLVDDKHLNLEIVKGILKETDIEVIEATNGAEAVSIMEASEEGLIDMILMDIHMPVMKGNEAANKIRKIDRKDCRNIPIIALSSKSTTAEETDAYFYGMNGWLEKPVDPDSIYECLENWLAS